MKSLIEWKTVCLLVDHTKSENKDKYWRLLRYVKLDDISINSQMVEEWYAYAYTIFPFEHSKDYKLLEKKAKKNNLWLWDSDLKKQFKKEKTQNEELTEDCTNDWTICPEDAKKYIGETKTVRFLVKNSYDNWKIIFFNSKNNYKNSKNFTVVIFETNRNKFAKDIADLYKHKVIEVSWTIVLYKWRAEIIVEDPGQIRMLVEN